MTRAFIFLLLLVAASCGPAIRVRTDYDPDFDLWQYKTFDWALKKNIEAGKNPLYYNELNDKRIKTAVKEQLSSRGYSYSEDKPDLIIHYHIAVDDKSIVVPESYGYKYGPYYDRMRTSVYAYREGTLILDLMDSKNNNLIWRGWAVSILDDGTYEPEEIDKLIRAAVSKVFKEFPARKENTVTNSINP
jgi:Domain of unknown function (DUF4136)